MQSADKRGLSRRGILKGGVGLSTLGIIGAPAVISRANAQSSFDWKRFKGAKIDVMFSTDDRANSLQEHEKEFKELTGIEVSSEQIPEQQQRQKAMIELTAGRPTFDIVHLSLHVQKRLAAKGKWLTDLRPMIANPDLTSPDFDLSDFGEAGMKFATQLDGSLDTIPLFVDYWIVYYNKEMFAKKGVPVPATLDDMVKAAAALNDPANGISGFVARGMKNANTPVWCNLLLGQNISTVDPSGKLTTDTPEALWAAELYTKLNKDFGPQGVVGFNWSECQTNFMLGKSAMWTDGIGFSAPLEDATKSQIAGKVGFAVMPPGPKGHHAGTFADGMGIARASENQGASWFYVQWATNKVNQLRLLESGLGAPARKSPYANKDVISKSTFGQEWFDTVLGSARIGMPALPEIIPVTEFRDTFGIALSNMLGGANPASELKKATEAFKPVLEKSERG
jgi:multiple sugar transport system substrate-binding protein